MDDSTLVALIGESLLAETAARREAGRAILDAARCVEPEHLCARLAERHHRPDVRIEIGHLLCKFGLYETTADGPFAGFADACAPLH